MQTYRKFLPSFGDVSNVTGLIVVEICSCGFAPDISEISHIGDF